MDTPDSLTHITLDDARSMERAGKRLHLAPSLRAVIPDGTPEAQQLAALRGSMRSQLLVVQADTADEPTDVQLGILARDEMLLDSEDARTLEVCDRNIAELRRRMDAVLPQLLDSSAIARRSTVLGAMQEEQDREQALSQLRALEQNIVALRLQWEGSLYHQWIRDRRHAQQHRERFRTAMQQDYDRQSQALGYIEGYALVGEETAERN